MDEAKKQFIKIVEDIVEQARDLRDKYTIEKSAPVNYVCIFSHDDIEYNELLAVAHELGTVVHETKMGLVFQIQPINTVSGQLELLKIRKPDSKRPERGDADFTVSDYPAFKKMYLGKLGFGIIVRPNMEMIELANPTYDVLAYFSYPPLF